MPLIVDGITLKGGEPSSGIISNSYSVAVPSSSQEIVTVVGSKTTVVIFSAGPGPIPIATTDVLGVSLE